MKDDQQVLSLTVQALRDLGYRVIEAHNAREALDALSPDISLLFTDIVIPEMDGHRLAEEALQRRPDLKVLFTTGYSRHPSTHRDGAGPHLKVLHKPASLQDLAAKVREVLDRDCTVFQ